MKETLSDSPASSFDRCPTPFQPFMSEEDTSTCAPSASLLSALQYGFGAHYRGQLLAQRSEMTIPTLQESMLRPCCHQYCLPGFWGGVVAIFSLLAWSHFFRPVPTENIPQKPLLPCFVPFIHPVFVEFLLHIWHHVQQIPALKGTACPQKKIKRSLCI